MSNPALQTFSQSLPGRKGDLLCLIAGSGVTLSLAPFNIWPAGILSAFLLFWQLQGLSPRQAFIRGWAFGLGMLGTGASWVYVSIHVYGYAPIPLASFLTVLWCGGIAILTGISCYLFQRFLLSTPLATALAFSAVWVLNEWVRTWLFTGFPWLFLGYGHLHSPLNGWVPIGGVLLVSLICVLTASLLHYAIVQGQQYYRRNALIAVGVLWLAGVGLNQIDWVQEKPNTEVTIGLVQANIPQEIKWARAQYQPTLNLYQQLTSPLWSDHDVVIWPEAAIPNLYSRAKGFLSTVDEQAKQADATLITGIPIRESGSLLKTHNSVVALGMGDGTYHKQKLVPFGEYVPMEDILKGLLAFFKLPMSAMSPGDANQQGLSAGELRLAPFICYEVVYPDLVASWLPNTDILLTISNDAWFGRSIGPKQHLQMAQMRSLENGRYMLRGTGSGISAIIDERGNIVTQGGQFTQEVVSGTAKVFVGSTPFSRTGSWPTLIILLLMVLYPLFLRRA